MKRPSRRKPVQLTFWTGRELALTQAGRRAHFRRLEAEARSNALQGRRVVGQDVWVKYVGGRRGAHTTSGRPARR